MIRSASGSEVDLTWIKIRCESVPTDLMLVYDMICMYDNDI